MIENVYIGQNNLAKQVNALYLGTEGEATKLFEYNPIEIVTWANGTDEQIAAMLQAHYDGVIDIHDYWSVGDERTVTLSAMEATGVGESHAQQSVTFVLSNSGGKYLSDGVTECAFQVDLKDCLAESGYMYSSNDNQYGWDGINRRTWCNSVFRNAIPETLRGIFKQHINPTEKQYYPTTSRVNIVNSIDYFALRSEIELLGTTSGSVPGEGTQVEYYKTASNRIKQASGSNVAYWTRSPYINTESSYVACGAYGYIVDVGAAYSRFIAPFGCI